MTIQVRLTALHTRHLLSMTFIARQYLGNVSKLRKEAFLNFFQHEEPEPQVLLTETIPAAEQDYITIWIPRTASKYLSSHPTSEFVWRAGLVRSSAMHPDSLSV